MSSRIRQSLGRQVAAAIQHFNRGNAFNQRGEFIRCKLTRLVPGNKWEKEKQDKAWDGKETESEVPSVADLQENVCFERLQAH